LIQAHLICEDTLEENWEEVSLPVDKPAAGRFMHILFPISDYIDLPGAILEALLCFCFQNVLENQTLAVVNDRLTQEVVASTKGSGNSCHQVLDPSVQGLLVLLLSEVLESESQDIGDLSSNVTVDQDDPLIDKILLGLEFNLNCLEHFNSLENVFQAIVRKGGASCLMDHH